MTEIVAEKLPGNKKLSGFIKTHRDNTFVLNFPHGLGDVIMFYPLLEKLRSLFPKTRIDLKVKSTNEGCGFESFDKDFKYDYLVHIRYWATDGAYPYTKNNYCCMKELGIEPPEELYTTKVKQFSSPLVTLGFTSNCEPERYGCPKDIAKNIYDGVIAAGFVPMLLHFKTSSAVLEPNNYEPFIKNSTTGCAVNFRNLIGLIQRSHAYIGVTSGPMWVALASLGKDRCMCLENRRQESWKCVPLDKMRFTYQFDITKEYVKEWLLKIPETPNQI